GLSLGTSFQAMKPAIDLATAAQLDLGKAADITAKILADARVPVQQLTTVQDQLLTASRTIGGDISRLGEAFAHGYPEVKAYGASLTEATALSVLFAARGVSGLQAAEQIQKTFRGISEETDTFKKKFEEAGAKISDFDPHGRSLSSLFDDLA